MIYTQYELEQIVIRNNDFFIASMVEAGLTEQEIIAVVLGVMKRQLDDIAIGQETGEHPALRHDPDD